MHRCRGIFSIAGVVLSVGLAVAADDATGSGHLKLVESASHEDMKGVVSVAFSPDGRFVYTSAWLPGKLIVLARDSKSGKLDHVQTLDENDKLAGTTSVSISPDGRFAVAAAFRSKSTVLFSRDAKTGKLTEADIARDGEKGVTLAFPVEAAFSPDSRFVYVLDDNGATGGGAIAVFGLNDSKLVLASTDEGKDGCYAGARGIAFHPNGKTIFVAANRSGAVVVADRDPESGKTHVVEVVKDDVGEVHGLAGAMGVTISPDGRFIYASAGRFHGDDAVTGFQVGADGRLIFVQEFINGEGQLRDFEGGNHLAISGDGLNVYAAGTRSRTIACFRRDPATGRLTYLETIRDGGAGGELGATATGVSPDGKFVYVSTEDENSITVFERDTGHAPIKP